MEFIFDEEIIRTTLLRSWSAETSSLWTAGCPSRGQCGVTALVLRDVFGGRILKTYPEGLPHFYNIFDNKVYDFTSEQFMKEIRYDDIPADDQEIFYYNEERQYMNLKTAFLENWNQLMLQTPEDAE